MMRWLFVFPCILSFIRLANSYNNHITVFSVRGRKSSTSNHRYNYNYIDPKYATSPKPLQSVSTEDDISNSPVLRSIDSKMQNIYKMKEKYTEILDKYQNELDVLQSQKQEYLEGMRLGKVARNFSESPLRSAVKAILWRIIAGGITFITSLKFSGDITTALKIVGSDFSSKVLTMFIGERLMNKSQAGRKTGSDSASRSMVKALVWRAFAVVNTLAASLFFAKDLRMASKIAGSDAIFKTFLMFLYERLWSKIEWGKEYIIEFSI